MLGGYRIVSRALELLVLPAIFVTRTEYSPALVGWTLARTSAAVTAVGLTAAGMGALFKNHWKLSGAVPVAATLKPVVAPRQPSGLWAGW